MSESIIKTVSFDAFKWIVGSLVVAVIALSGIIWGNLTSRVDGHSETIDLLGVADTEQREAFLVLATRLDARLLNIEDKLDITTPKQLRLDKDSLFPAKANATNNLP